MEGGRGGGGGRGRIVDAACVQLKKGADVTSLARPSRTPEGDALLSGKR